MHDNPIPIGHLQTPDPMQTVTLTVGDIRAIITLLECATAHLLLPDEATAALAKLKAAAHV